MNATIELLCPVLSPGKACTFTRCRSRRSHGAHDVFWIRYANFDGPTSRPTQLLRHLTTIAVYSRICSRIKVQVFIGCSHLRLFGITQSVFEFLISMFLSLFEIVVECLHALIRSLV